MDEVIAVVDTSSVAQAEMDATSAALDAERAARDAELAAASAAGATVAQGQLIGAVMEHAREDARESASDAEEAAKESEQAAELAVAVNAMTVEQYQEICRRLDAIEARYAERETEQEAAPTIAEIGGEEQQTDDAQSTPESTPEGNPEATGRPATRRKHGRRGR